MPGDLIELERGDAVASITLNRPEQRNALSAAMMDKLVETIDAVALLGASVVLLRANGPAFCAGFDLADAVAQPGLMARYIEQLGAITRRLRRLPQVVVAAAHGPALAGGCAIISACDFVVAAPEAQFGYPVHRIGVSPAVTIPTLRQAIGDGRCREMLLGGRIIDGREGHRLGLVSHLAASAETVQSEAEKLCRGLAAKGASALRATKRWLNELDGSVEEAPFDAVVAGSAALAVQPESEQLLRDFWNQCRPAR